MKDYAYKHNKLTREDFRLIKKKKLLIYKWVLSYIKQSYDKGLYDNHIFICKSVHLALESIFNLNYIYIYIFDLSSIHYPNKYPELIKYKPQCLGYTQVWFNMDKIGMCKRISIVENIIADLKIQIKGKTHGKV